MAPVKKNTKAPVKKTPVKKAAAPVKKAAAPAEDTEAGSKRKRVTFSKKLTEEEPKTKKAATNKKKAAAPVAAPVVEEEESEDEVVPVAAAVVEEEEEELTEEQEEALRKEILGDIASSEGEDSSDEEADGIDANENVVALDTEKLKESMAETKKVFDKKAKATKAAKVEEKGVVYVGRIPHGFYEKEMKGYFSQFGDISRLRLSRNKKTGSSKHYAFIEFESADVAQIVTETMDNYLLFNNLLKCKMIPTEKVHEKLFVGANKTYKPFNYVLRNRQQHNKPMDQSKLAAKHAKILKDEQNKREKLKEAGIDYDFPSYA
ncbi:hypothetical protein BDF21DRAFT_456840 [Thamnidium elegans]|nr:hypothetical protein BDF21DRAFT_456840 [Thamnidium elegans]